MRRLRWRSAKPVTTSPPPAAPASARSAAAPTDVAYRPFCSRRCADVDLSRWLSGAYAIPARPDDDEDGESTEPSADADKPGPDSAH